MVGRRVVSLIGVVRGTSGLQWAFDAVVRLADYLELMSVRMGERLRYTLDLPDELRGTPVPPLLLQPLVENSIRHGLEPKVEGGAIDVRARQLDGRLIIEVSDTGVGLDAAQTSEGSGSSRCANGLPPCMATRAA